MIDWKQITGFDRDAGNARKSIDKHSVSRFEAAQIFFNEPLLVLMNEKHSQTEVRYHTLGRTDNKRLLHVTFTLRARNTLIRVISARDMHRKERVIYEQS